MHDNMRLIVVVMGGASSRIRFQEAANLLSMGFDTYQKVVALKKDQPFNQILPIKKGNRRSIRPIVAEDAVVVIKRGEEKGISLQPNLPAFIVAPINKGQEVGKVSVQLANRTLATFPLVAPEDVPKHWFWRLFDFK
jgi:D-alanyl-D-alanine carboxypeptidase (penicillin-binding protein 5/6)